MTHASEHDPLERERQLQRAAEHGTITDPSASDVHEIRRYRFIYEVLGRDALEPPDDFAEHMEALVRDHAEDAVVESWLLAALPAMAMVVLLLTAVLLRDVGSALGPAVRHLPWHVIAMIGSSMVAAVLLDQVPGLFRRTVHAR